MENMESRYMGLINLTCKEPWKHQKRDLAMRFKITNEKADWLIRLLRLEVKGYEMKNRREEIVYYILSNPLATAKTTAESLGCTEYLVYAAARNLGIKMQSEYSLKRLDEFKTINTF